MLLVVQLLIGDKRKQATESTLIWFWHIEMDTKYYVLTYPDVNCVDCD